MTPARKAPPILALMIISILVLGAIALWDEQRESAAALDEFAAEQSSLAREAAATLVARLGATGRGGSGSTSGALLAPTASALEHPGAVLALFQRPSSRALVSASGETIRSAALETAIEKGQPWVRLSRDEAAALGLPARLAIAGLATADGGEAGQWRVAIIASALRVRDREARAMWRLVLGFTLASALIAAFGVHAQRKQKKEIELARTLAIAEAMQARDERLVRADKLATMGALATGIAHEVSTPLGVIVARAEQLLAKVETDERATRSVNAITEQAARITHIVRAFLRLARGGTPSLERTEPAKLADAALELVEHRFTKANVTLRRHLSPELPRVACDPKLIEQVLVNLLLNACDACEEGGSVELSVASDNQRVCFIVTDDGEGITAEVAARATEPFFTTKSESNGTGLGLAIANEIVKHHHGELFLAPRKGARGTRAVVELAAVRENEHG